MGTGGRVCVEGHTHALETVLGELLLQDAWLQVLYMLTRKQ